MSGQSDLSVVICTHNRLGELAECLEALAGQQPGLDVIVVDSAPQQPAEELVAGYRSRIERLQYIRVDEPGLSLARNRGVERSAAPVVAFLDDDAAPCEGWANAISDAFARRPRAGCVGGACLPRFEGVRPPWLSDRLLQLASITRWGVGERQPRSSAEWPFGANMAFRKEALVGVGEFSTDLGRRGSESLLSGEDSDMVSRVLTAGWEVWLEPGAPVVHKVHAERLSSRFYWRRFWWGGVSRAQTPTPALSARVLVAAPLRLLAWIATRDRIFLYRQAEAVGYFWTLVRRYVQPRSANS